MALLYDVPLWSHSADICIDLNLFTPFGPERLLKNSGCGLSLSKSRQAWISLGLTEVLKRDSWTFPFWWTNAYSTNPVVWLHTAGNRNFLFFWSIKISPNRKRPGSVWVISGKVPDSFAKLRQAWMHKVKSKRILILFEIFQFIHLQNSFIFNGRQQGRFIRKDFSFLIRNVFCACLTFAVLYR